MTKKNLCMAFISILFLFAGSTLFAQTTYKEITDKFFSIYSKDPIKAVDYAFSTNKWFDRKEDATTNLKNKLKNLIDLCGEYYGYEELTQKSAGTSLLIVTFIIKYEREPLRFTFLLYKAKDIWRVNNFSFDEDIDTELEEAAKAYRLKENY